VYRLDLSHASYEVSAAMKIRVVVFWVVTPCSVVMRKDTTSLHHDLVYFIFSSYSLMPRNFIRLSNSLISLGFCLSEVLTEIVRSVFINDCSHVGYRNIFKSSRKVSFSAVHLLCKCVLKRF
jgi:hypothetical protein